MRTVWIAIVVASLGWGLAGVGTRFVLDEGMEPVGLVLVRSLLATVAVVAYVAARRGTIPRDPVAWKVGMTMGATNLAIPFVLTTIALEHASAGFLGILTALIPLTTAIVAHFMVGETLTLSRTLGLLVGFGGVGALLLSGDSGLAEGGRPLLAGGLGLAAVLSISGGSVYAKRHAGQYRTLDVTGIHFGTGLVIIAVTALVSTGVPTEVSGEAWLWLTALALGSTFLPFVLFYWMMRKVSITYASMVGYVVPLIAVASGIAFLDEQLDPGIAIGGLMILAGVVITDRTEVRVPVAQ